MNLKQIYRPSGEKFEDTLKLQQELLAKKISGEISEDLVVFVEHDHVYTVGRSEKFQRVTEESKSTVAWHEISRGGQATYHGPGQLVAYPIVDLRRQGKDVHVYLRKLEGAVILCLREFGIEGERVEGQTGVWTRLESGELKKLASIGIGVRKWISYHGLALNVSTDLSYFKAISACGQSGQVVSSLLEILGEAPPLSEVSDVLAQCLAKVFNLETSAKRTVKTFKPSWLKVKSPVAKSFNETDKVVHGLNLVTVCEEARCPNLSECWSHHTATFMIMGESCTRRCGFCSVKDGVMKQNLDPLDPLEPYRVAQAVKKLGLKHVVITSVNRDDLEDMGAKHFDKVVQLIHREVEDCKVELLIPDMQGKKNLLLKILASGGVSVLNHNIETVPRLYRHVRPGAKFERSLDILRWAGELQNGLKTKSGIMVGLGESEAEVYEVMDRLRQVNCDILTIGQYLQPTEKQLPVDRYVTPQEFAKYKEEGLKRGFKFVESGPLVRSSYHAWQHVEWPQQEKVSL